MTRSGATGVELSAVGMLVRLDHASLQASDLSRADLASEAGLKAAPGGCGVVAVACSSHCTPLGGARWVENNVVTSARAGHRCDSGWARSERRGQSPAVTYRG